MRYGHPIVPGVSVRSAVFCADRSHARESERPDSECECRLGMRSGGTGRRERGTDSPALRTPLLQHTGAHPRTRTHSCVAMPATCTNPTIGYPLVGNCFHKNFFSCWPKLLQVLSNRAETTFTRNPAIPRNNRDNLSLSFSLDAAGASQSPAVLRAAAAGHRPCFSFASTPLSANWNSDACENL